MEAKRRSRSYEDGYHLSPTRRARRLTGGHVEPKLERYVGDLTSTLLRPESSKFKHSRPSPIGRTSLSMLYDGYCSLTKVLKPCVPVVHKWRPDPIEV